jgi:molecular chaperone HtpG
MKDMSKMGGGGYSFMGNMPDNYNVAVNGNHTIVQKILKAEGEEQKAKLAKQAYDLALLSQNMLTGTDLTNFIKRSVELVS